MEFTFSDLKLKDVININDGKHLGKVCDMTFTFPENKVKGFTVTGCKGFKFSRQDVFLPVKCIEKIGKDAILVNFGEQDNFPPQPPQPKPPQCPPPCPPKQPRGGAPFDRRSYDEYE